MHLIATAAAPAAAAADVPSSLAFLAFSSRPLKSSIVPLKLDTLWWTEWKRRIESQLQLATKLSAADSAPIHRLLTRKSGEQREAPSLPFFLHSFPVLWTALRPSFWRSQRNSATEIHISLETTKNKRRTQRR